MHYIVKPNLTPIRTFLRLYSIIRRSHYDVLRLKKNCSDKDIKDAFVKLSKQYHPDKNKDANAHEQFVRIAEAYNILGKPTSRAQYDSTTYVSHTYGAQQSTSQNQEYYYTQNKDPYDEFREYRQKNNMYEHSAENRIPKHVIVLLCAAFGLVGLVVQMIVIRKSFFMHRETLEQTTKRNAEALAKVRATAAENGNELQTRILLEKIVSSANPTVATASLGQALASDDKDFSKPISETIEYFVFDENVKGHFTKK